MDDTFVESFNRYNLVNHKAVDGTDSVDDK